MTLSLATACLWVVMASLIAFGPRRYHWPAAWALVAVGVPILGWVTYENGPVWGLVVLAGGMSVLRWPVRRMLTALGRRAD